jgi:hypothetical protein
MTRSRFLTILAAGLPAVLLTAQESPLSSQPKVELKGRIEKVRISMGEGMPFLEIKTDSGTEKVMLGSVRYLLEQNFNPKAGEEAVVKAYKMNETLIAITVQLSPGGKTVRFRDENGRPLWMRGRYRGGR